MNRIKKIVQRCMTFALFCLITMLGSRMVHAQGVSPQNADLLYITSRDIANYGSLLNSYYLKKYAKSVNRHYSRNATDIYAEFDQIPDSVLAKRLRRIPTVVPMSYNANVRSYIRVYVRLMEKRCDVLLGLSEYYFPIFEEALYRYGVPEELKYLTIVESALNPQATSRAGAAGLWQFMYRTGKNYDLEVNSLVDERRDPYASSIAAARFLRDLYNIYHDWTLAIAAYNCGPGNVNKAIARTGKSINQLGGRDGFWIIYPYLPSETRGYVPAFIAATYIFNYYHEHGIRPQKIKIPINADTIYVKKDALYCHIEKYTGIESEELRTLNPQYRTNLVPANAGFHTLTIPASKLHTFIQMEDSIYKATNDSLSKKPVVVTNTTSGTNTPEQRIVHKVKKGETMSKIASKYGVTTSQIQRWNGRRGTVVRIGESLVIYRKNPNYRPEATSNETTSKNATTDSSTVVNKNLTMDTARKEPLNTYEPIQDTKTTPKSTPAKKVTHTVKKGESLSSISRQYNVPVKTIMSRNGLTNDRIREGQKLIIK